MNRVNQVVKLHLRNKNTWFMIPWAILGANFLINALIALSLNDGEVINTGAIVSIFIYSFVAGIVTIKETFPFAIGLSIRRKDYFLGTALTVILVNILSGIVLTVLSAIEQATNGWNVNLHLFEIGFLSDLSFISLLGINVILLVHAFFLGFAISSLYRRLGGISMYVFFTAMLLIGTIASYVMTHFDLWADFGHWIADHYLELFWWLIPLVVIYSIISYGLLRRAAV
ncbi:hypothetical protein ASG89_34430 [Paenibacillus sp. Soil766]|uniref:hypothetical protein n=1 Tax=Paenibacillus sp. Soil766 TaxID=1736404 RepID=UPI00070A1E7D|nr:hypothetical protein [Paenibacillus sp. Soil766]KRE91139.1 hypothetical protein ASG89_34430 [Paenibacillus sp. Soil766]